MSNAALPISRKIILQKQSEQVDLERYNQIPTTFYEKEEQADQLHSIYTYLTQSQSFIEYLPIPYPTFDECDLKKELSIQRHIQGNDYLTLE